MTDLGCCHIIPPLFDFRLTPLAQRLLHASIEGNRVKRDLAVGCLSFWLLLLGQARKSNSVVGTNPDAVVHQKGKLRIYLAI